MNLAEAFAIYGAEGPRRTRRRSAVARDGAIILGCSARRFSRPAAGVLRYEDDLSGDSTTPESQRALSQHLELARAGSLPVRLIIITESRTAETPASRTIHVRRDLVGSVVDLNAEHYVVDFVKVVEPD